MNGVQSTLNDIDGCGLAAWESHWQKTSNTAAFEESTPLHTYLQIHWSNFLKQAISPHNDTKLIDLACGKGTVSELAASQDNAVGTGRLDIHCVDATFSAVTNVAKRLNISTAVQANCASLPYQNDSFDLVVSQFGIEYAPAHSANEFARILKSSGRFASVIHYKNGAIYQDCNEKRKLIEKVLSLNLFEKAQVAFTAGYAVVDGKLPLQVFQKADADFAPVIEQYKQLIISTNSEVKSLLIQILKDMGFMYENIASHREQDVSAWLTSTKLEFINFKDRMSSMVNAAMDEDQICQMLSPFLAKGFTQTICERLSVDNDPPFAWFVQIANINA
ncbi:Methyltransferase type 11 [Glaciecola sp. 4H-3-7+YE-5]|nr:Methyltransferase type 11 [Glaciecola sp. 4H-3-7+YE-5]